MNTENAIGLYIHTAQLVLRADAASASICNQNITDLSHCLPHLRQLLSCAVCCRLLSDPYSPRDGRCLHNVCRLCVRNRKILQPSCSGCRDLQDYKTYDENRQMRCLLLCYKSLCEHLMASSQFALLSKQKPTYKIANVAPRIPLPNMSTQEFVLEGASYEDILTSFNCDLPHSVTPRLQLTTATTAPTPPSNTMQVTAHNQTVLKVAMPPMSTNSSFITPQFIKQEPTSIDSTQSLNSTTTVSASTTAHTKLLKTVSTASPTFTYVGSNAPGIVVPIVSSSITTSAPLTIASSKLQSLNRQLAQAQAHALANKAKAANAEHPPLTYTASSSAVTTATATTTATVTSQELRNPPPIKTVSNGSAMYSVLYTGIGNKITIKRKTEGDEDGNQRKNAATTAMPAVIRHISKTSLKRYGCRCGNATPTPGKLTCCGQRCPCYVNSKSCINCKCRGCRNPHRPDGGKVRPVIPELACYEIQMADDNNSLSPSELSLPTTRQAHPVTESGLTTIQQQPQQQSQQQQQRLQHLDGYITHLPMQQLNTSQPMSSNAATLLPMRNFQQMSVISTNQQQQQQIQTPTQLSTANILQLENLQHESVLIQNAEGKYQVVNVFTTTPHQNQNVNKTSNLQRMHAISQLQAAATTTHSSNDCRSSTNNMLTNSNSTESPVTTVSLTTGISNTLKQTQRIVGSSTVTRNSTTMLLEQQLKPNNVIQMHHNRQQLTTASHVTMISQPTTATTATLSPIIVNTNNTFSSDIFHESSNELVNVKKECNTNVNNITATVSNQLTPAMLEIFEPSDS